MYEELNLTEISFKLEYSSVAHLSSQFKKITGLTPSQFKQLKEKKRDQLEEIGNGNSNSINNNNGINTINDKERNSTKRKFRPAS